MKYPNLEMLEYKTRQFLKQCPEFNKLLMQKRAKENRGAIEFEAIVFPQLWGSTSLGFDVTEGGDPTWGGQMMTSAYTTVFHELTTDYYAVCFGDQPCYGVLEANAKFFEDLDKRRMASLSEAKKLY